MSADSVGILVVDDDEYLRRMLVRLVKERARDGGIGETSVYEAASLLEAEDYAQRVDGVISGGGFPFGLNQGARPGSWLMLLLACGIGRVRFSLFTGDQEQLELAEKLFLGGRMGVRAFAKPIDGRAAIEWALNGAEFP